MADLHIEFVPADRIDLDSPRFEDAIVRAALAGWRQQRPHADALIGEAMVASRPYAPDRARDALVAGSPAGWAANEDRTLIVPVVDDGSVDLFVDVRSFVPTRAEVKLLRAGQAEVVARRRFGASVRAASVQLLPEPRRGLFAGRSGKVELEVEFEVTRSGAPVAGYFVAFAAHPEY